MDYKKAYEDALERARKFTIPDAVEALKYVFPELAESEDERIRKWIINFIEVRLNGAGEFIDDYKNAIAWLEKQGESKWSEEDKMILNEIKKFFTLNELPAFKESCDIIDWLNKLKPQSHWKPTEEQLMALRDAIDNNEMESLYNDLKRL